MSDPTRYLSARDVMTPDAAVCPAAATLDQVAKLMLLYDCRVITIIDLRERPVGIVTDRDIIPVVAEGRNPLTYPVEACMSRPVVTVRDDALLSDVIATMHAYRVRSVPVVDGDGRVVGLISDVDLAVAARGMTSRSQTPGAPFTV
jgi:CBS domain-containing protein